MDSSLIVIENFKYDEAEVDRCCGLFMANQNKFLTKKYPQLRDAEVVEVSTKSRSVLDLCGIQIKEKYNQKSWFICHLGSCFDKGEAIILSKSSTYNATAHLYNKHNLLASKTEANNWNVAKINKQIEVADEQFWMDPCQWFEVYLSVFACENSVAYKAFESNTRKLIANKLPVGHGRSLQSINLRKHYVEHYVSIKENIMSQIGPAQKYYNIPFYLSPLI